MELFLELILTLCLSLFFTSLFIKLASMQPMNTDSDKDGLLTEESLKIDKFQRMPFEDEMIKLEECPNEGKSSVEFYNVVGVEMEDSKFHDVVVLETLESTDGKTEVDNNIGEDNDDDDDYKFQDKKVGSEDENRGERKLSEIEIESVEEEENKNEIMNDWEEIGRKDFEELLGNKTGLYYAGVDDDYEK